MSKQDKWMGIKRLKFLHKENNFLDTYGVTPETADNSILHIDEYGAELESLTVKMYRLAELNRERNKLINSIVEDLNN